jgi:hypothetical protein
MVLGIIITPFQGKGTSTIKPFAAVINSAIKQENSFVIPSQFGSSLVIADKVRTYSSGTPNVAQVYEAIPLSRPLSLSANIRVEQNWFRMTSALFCFSAELITIVKSLNSTGPRQD